VFLEKWQRNAIFEAIMEAKLNPRDFELEDDGDEARIRVGGSKSIFVIGRDRAVLYSVNKAVGEGPLAGYGADSWDGLMHPLLSLWLSEVKRDQQTPDLFAELQRERDVLVTAAAAGAENTPFTHAEQDEIAKRLSEIQEYMEKTHDLSLDQKQALDAGISELRAAAGRLGRRDWFGLAVGTLTILQAVLPPGSIRHIFLMLVQGLAHLHGFPELPPPG